MKSKLDIRTYAGGMAETNAYLVSSKAGWLAIDAPEGMLDFLEEQKIERAGLVLMHGHWDHIWDAAGIARKFSCAVYYHQADEVMYQNPDVMTSFGLPVKLEPVKATRLLAEGDVLEHGELKFRILHVPGHSQGSICLYEAERGVLFGGDVLFAGGVGRWDLPGGNHETLMNEISRKILSLPDETIVYSGHGPSTTVGKEKKSNPFL